MQERASAHNSSAARFSAAKSYQDLGHAARPLAAMVEHALADVAGNAEAGHHGTDGAAEIMHANVAQPKPVAVPLHGFRDAARRNVAGTGRVREHEAARPRFADGLPKRGECQRAQRHAVSVVVLGSVAGDNEGRIAGLEIEVADPGRGDLARRWSSAASVGARLVP